MQYYRTKTGEIVEILEYNDDDSKKILYVLAEPENEGKSLISMISLYNIERHEPLCHFEFSRLFACKDIQEWKRIEKIILDARQRKLVAPRFYSSALLAYRKSLELMDLDHNIQEITLGCNIAKKNYSNIEFLSRYKTDHLVNGNDKLLHQSSLILEFNEPFTQKTSITVYNKNGFTKNDIVQEIQKTLLKCYQEEMDTDPEYIPIHKRPNNELFKAITNGKWKMLDYDYEDLGLDKLIRTGPLTFEVKLLL